MALETVWDKDGNPHKMTPPNARDLVNFAGWTRVPTMVLEAVEATNEAFKAAEEAADQAATAKALEAAQKAAEEKAAQIAAAAEVAAAAAQKAAEEAKEKEEAAEVSSEPNKMNVEQLTELAKGLGVDVDRRWSKTRLLQEIQAASKKVEE